MELKTENELFPLFLKDILFVVAHNLDVPSLISFMLTCKMVLKARENRDIWQEKMALYFPATSIVLLNNPPSDHYHTLFLETSKAKYVNLSSEMKKIVALVCANDFEQIKSSALVFTDKALRTYTNKQALWQWVKKNKNQALNDYIFNQLLGQNYSFEIICKWAMVLDQTDYFKQHPIENFANCFIDGKSLLSYCVQFDLKHAAQQLLLLGYNPNVTTGNNPTALCFAIQKKRYYFVNLLLKNKAAVEMIFNGRPPLYIASQQGNLKIVQCLIEAGAAVNGRSVSNASALHVAMQNGHVPIIQYLLEQGADIFARDDRGYLPIHSGSLSGKKEGLEVLLSFCKKDDKVVNALCDDGFSALHLASENGSIDICKLLMENGADINQKNHANQTSMDVAKEEGYLDIVNLLLQNNDLVSGEVPRCHVVEQQDFEFEQQEIFFQIIEQSFKDINYQVIEADYSTAINHIIDYYSCRDSFFNLGFFDKNNNLVVLEQLFNSAPRYFGPICCLWLVLSDKNTPYTLQEMLSQSFDLSSTDTPKSVLELTLEIYLNDNIDLLIPFYNEILQPLTKGFVSNVQWESGYYDAAMCILNFYEIQFAKIQNENTFDSINLTDDSDLSDQYEETISELQFKPAEKKSCVIC